LEEKRTDEMEMAKKKDEKRKKKEEVGCFQIINNFCLIII